LDIDSTDIGTFDLSDALWLEAIAETVYSAKA
jgi:putative methionine-R-sulfoxide reductase with GAF domain